MERVRVDGMYGKLETTYGTDSTPGAATDAIQIEEHLWSNIEIGYLFENTRENAAIGGMGRIAAGAKSGRWIHATVKIALKGSGSAYAAKGDIEINVLMEISGHGATVVTTTGTESIEYEPVSDNFESATVVYESAHRKFKSLGTIAQLTSIEMAPGAIGIATFDLWGILSADPTTEDPISSFTYPNLAVVPPAWKNAGLSMDAYDPDDVRSFTFNMNTEVPERPGANATDAFAGYAVMDWNPEFTVVIDSPPLASFDPWDKLATGNVFAADWTLGSTQYNRVKFAASNVQILELSHTDDRGYAALELRCRCLNSSALNDAYTFTWD